MIIIYVVMEGVLGKHTTTRETPTESTARKRIPATTRDSSQGSEPAEPWQHRSWRKEELKALILFVLFYHGDSTWPCHSNMHMWRSAGSFIKMKVNSLHQRSGK